MNTLVGGYFGAQANVVPLLHLWSLAVEEQFYLLWPLILFAAWRILNRWALILFVLVVIVLGAVISEWGVQNYRAAAYYLLPTRFFELMIGALLAVLPHSDRRWARGRDWLSLLGVGLILYSATRFTTERLFPGYSALVPCLGTALILYAARVRQGIVGHALSLAPMVYVGRISYPAYLWHWPIIAFVNLNLIAIDALVGSVILVVTLILSALTYHTIEKPVRLAFQHSHWGRVVGFGFAAPALLVTAFSLSLWKLDGWPGRFSPELALKSQALQSYSNRIRGRCNEGNVTNPLSEDECVLGAAGRPVDFLLIGDSHANHFTGMLDRFAQDAGMRGWDITQSQTIFLPGVRLFYDQDGDIVEHNNFALRNRYLEQLIAQRRFKAVVLGGSFAVYYNGDGLRRVGAANSAQAFEEGFRAAIEQIVDSGAIPVIIVSTPHLNVGGGNVSHQCTLNNLRFGQDALCTVSADAQLGVFAKWRTFLAGLKRDYPQIVTIEPDRVICNRVACVTEIDGVPLYRDSGHLNHMGSELIGRVYIARFGNPLFPLSERRSDQ